jgi:hypothetical protein
MTIKEIVDLGPTQADGNCQAEPTRARLDPKGDTGRARMFPDCERHGAAADLKRSRLRSQGLAARTDRFLEEREHRLYLADSRKRRDRKTGA